MGRKVIGRLGPVQVNYRERKLVMMAKFEFALTKKTFLR
jgi:hypothetical protein